MSAIELIDDVLEVNPQSLVGQSFLGGNLNLIPIQDEQLALYRGDFIIIFDWRHTVLEVIERERLWAVTTL